MRGNLCSSFRVFTINDIKANVDDFGVSKDWKPENAPDYGCGHRAFHAFNYLDKKVLDKYHINESEWQLICNMLEDELYIGCCNYCE